MIRLRTIPIVPCIRRHALLLALAAFVIGLVTIGCNGGGDNDGGQFIPATGWKQLNSTYVGAINCRDCHANIFDQYTQEQPMGVVDPANSHADERHTGTSCAGCHTTGIGQPTGGVLPVGTTPLLDNIGCEACHGPGSKHIAAASIEERHANITRVPPDKTCIDCHGGRKSTPDGYRPGALDQPFTPVTAAEYSGTKPNSVRGPHQASAGLLFGRYGYGHTEASPSPHSTIPNTCVACHQKSISPITGKVDHGANAQHPDVNTNQVNCSSCHSGRSEQLVQIGVKETLIELGGEDPLNPGEPDPDLNGGMFGAFVAAHEIDITTNDVPDDPNVIAYKGARHNYKYVIGEGSMGVHNPGLVKRLLDETKALLETD